MHNHPIQNERGELIAYDGRSIDDTEPKYKLLAGFKKSQVLFNLCRVLDEDSTGARVLLIQVLPRSLGNGHGTFQPAVNFAVGSSLQSVAVSDLNGDRKPDLAVANARSNTVSVLTNTTP